MNQSRIIEGYQCYNRQQYVKALQHYRIAQQSQQQQDSKLILESVIAVINLQLCNYNEAHRILTQLRIKIKQYQRQLSHQYSEAKRQQLLLLKVKVACNLVIVELVNCQQEKVLQEIQQIIQLVEESITEENDLIQNQGCRLNFGALGKILFKNVLKSFYGFSSFKQIDSSIKTLMQQINQYYTNRDQQRISRKIKINLFKQSSIFYSSLSLIKQLEGNYQNAYNLQKLAYQISKDDKQNIMALLSCRHLIEISKKLNPPRSFEKYQEQIRRYMNIQQIKGISQQTLFRNYQKKIECASLITKKLMERQKYYDSIIGEENQRQNNIQNRWFKKIIVERLIKCKNRENEEKIRGILQLMQNNNESILELMKNSQFAKEAKEDYHNKLKQFEQSMNYIFKSYVQNGFTNIYQFCLQKREIQKEKQQIIKRQKSKNQNRNNQWRQNNEQIYKMSPNNFSIQISPRKTSKQKIQHASSLYINKKNVIYNNQKKQTNISISEVQQIKGPNLFSKYSKLVKGDQQHSLYNQATQSQILHSKDDILDYVEEKSNSYRKIGESRNKVYKQNEYLKHTSTFEKDQPANKLYIIGKKQKIQKSQIYLPNNPIQQPNRSTNRPKTEISLLQKHNIEVIIPKSQYSSAISEFMRTQKKFSKVQTQHSKQQKGPLIRITQKRQEQQPEEVQFSQTNIIEEKNIKQKQTNPIKPIPILESNKQRIKMTQSSNNKKHIPLQQSIANPLNKGSHLSILIQQDKPKLKDRDRIKLQMTAKLTKYLNLCRIGQYVEKRHFSSDGGQQRFVVVSKNKQKIMWSQNQEKLETGSCSQYLFKDIKGIAYGKISKTMHKQCNQKLQPWKCFSLFFKKRTFDIYCTDQKDLRYWLPGLSACFKPDTKISLKYSLYPHKIQHSKIQKKQFNKVYLNDVELIHFYSEGRMLWKRFLMKIKFKYLHDNKKDMYNIYGNANAFAILIAAEAQMKIKSPVLLRRDFKKYS